VCQASVFWARQSAWKCFEVRDNVAPMRVLLSQRAVVRWLSVRRCPRYPAGDTDMFAGGFIHKHAGTRPLPQALLACLDESAAGAVGGRIRALGTPYRRGSDLCLQAVVDQYARRDSPASTTPAGPPGRGPRSAGGTDLPGAALRMWRTPAETGGMDLFGAHLPGC
jgi:hypothetical protein